MFWIVGEGKEKKKDCFQNKTMRKAGIKGKGLTVGHPDSYFQSPYIILCNPLKKEREAILIPTSQISELSLWQV